MANLVVFVLCKDLETESIQMRLIKNKPSLIIPSISPSCLAGYRQIIALKIKSRPQAHEGITKPFIIGKCIIIIPFCTCFVNVLLYKDSRTTSSRFQNVFLFV